MVAEVREVSKEIYDMLNKSDFNQLFIDVDASRVSALELIDSLIEFNQMLGELEQQMDDKSLKLKADIKGKQLIREELHKRKELKKTASKKNIESLEEQLADLHIQVDSSKKELENALEEKNRVIESRYELLKERKKAESPNRLLYAVLRGIPVNYEALNEMCQTPEEAWAEIEQLVYNLEHPLPSLFERFPELREWDKKQV